MVQNLIQSAFETVRSVDDGVLLLDIFGHFSARESIKRYISSNNLFLHFIFHNAFATIIYPKKKSLQEQIH